MPSVKVSTETDEMVKKVQELSEEDVGMSPSKKDIVEEAMERYLHNYTPPSER